jgi:hypothetical protein
VLPFSHYLLLDYDYATDDDNYKDDALLLDAESGSLRQFQPEDFMDAFWKDMLYSPQFSINSGGDAFMVDLFGDVYHFNEQSELFDLQGINADFEWRCTDGKKVFYDQGVFYYLRNWETAEGEYEPRLIAWNSLTSNYQMENAQFAAFPEYGKTVYSMLIHHDELFVATRDDDYQPAVYRMSLPE